MTADDSDLQKMYKALNLMQSIDRAKYPGVVAGAIDNAVEAVDDAAVMLMDSEHYEEGTDSETED